MVQTETTDQAVRKSYWGIGVTVLYSIFALFILALVFVSISNPPQLVKVETTVLAPHYQEKLNGLRRSGATAGVINATFQAALNSIVLTCPSKVRIPEKGEVLLFGPGSSRLERSIEFALDELNEQQISTDELRPGMWRLLVLWNADGSDYYSENIVVLK